MSLNFINKHIIGAIIVDAIQKELETEMDPADGQWFTNGPDNNGGLYGKLVDELASELVFLPQEVAITVNKLAAATGIADNRNGLTPKQTITLSYSTSNSSSTSHTTTNALKEGVGVDIKASGTFLGVGADVTTKITTEYTFSWSETTSKTVSETKQFTQSVPTETPAGKVYQVVLTCDKANLNTPFFADIILSGNCVANFASPVNGKKTWIIDAGTLCEWINKHESAGVESSKYIKNPLNSKQGLIRLKGTLTASETANFIVNTFDITDKYNVTGKGILEVDQQYEAKELSAFCPL